MKNNSFHIILPNNEIQINESEMDPKFDVSQNSKVYKNVYFLSNLLFKLKNSPCEFEFINIKT